MPTEHFLYAKEPSFGTWTTPNKAIHSASADFGTEREVIDIRATGSGRGILQRVLGAKPVSGTLSTQWRVANIGTILSCFMTDAAFTGNDINTHALLFDDEEPHDGISVQNVYRTGLTAQNILSAYVNTWTISATNKETVDLEFAFLAKDEAVVGNNWDYNGGATPTYVANPGSLYPAIKRPFMFYDAQILIGGTPSGPTGNIISVSGSTAYAKVLSTTITVDNGLDAEGYGITQDPTRQEIWPGNREITATFDISWTDYSETFYDAARAGTPLAFQLSMVGPLVGAEQAEAHVIIPSLFFDPLRLPPISGEQGRRILSITGKSQEDTVTGYDFNVWFKSLDASPL